MKKLRESSIYLQFLVLAATSVAIFVLLFVGYGQLALRSMQEQTASYLNGTVSQLSRTVQQNYTTFSQIMKLAGYNSNLQEFLLSDNEAQKIEAYTRAKQDLNDFATLSASIRDIVVVDTSGNRYGINDSVVYDLPELSLTGTQVAVSVLQQGGSAGSRNDYLVAAQNIYSISNYTRNNQIIGTVYLVLDPDAFLGGDSEYSPTQGIWIFLQDREGSILWCAARDDCVEHAECPANAQQQQMEMLDGALRVTAFAEPTLWPERGNEVLAPLGLLILLLLVMGFIWILWAKRIVATLTKLTAFVEGVASADLAALPTARIRLSGYREVAILSNQISYMLAQIYELTRQLVQKNADLYEAELLAKQSELSSLRSQINPHFLYNTLETMVGIAYTEGQPKVAQIARALSLIFEYSIKGKPVVPLHEELTAVKNYVTIQSYRFGDRVGHNYQIDANVTDCMVPKMILQPLIENAVVHGMEGADHPCMLTIRAAREQNHLVLEVSDDGCGMDAVQLAALRERLGSGSPMLEENVRHIGLRNVHDRIRLMYGEPYGVQIESGLGQGTRVRIMLPVKEETTDHVPGNDC